MLGVDSYDKNKSKDQAVRAPVSERVQKKLDLRSAMASKIKPTDYYTLGQRVEDTVDKFSERPFLIYAGHSYSYKDVGRAGESICQIP